jgi:hypothetical protein
MAQRRNARYPPLSVLTEAHEPHRLSSQPTLAERCPPRQQYTSTWELSSSALRAKSKYIRSFGPTSASPWLVAYSCPFSANSVPTSARS